MIKAFRAIVHGRVQVVMYRDFARRAARALSVFGTVKNLPDGSVEIVAEGNEGSLDSFIEKLKVGPLLSKVDRVDVTWQQPLRTFTDFSIRY